MAQTSIPVYGDINRSPPLDNTLYSIGEEGAIFLKTWTGIQDDDALKSHIVAAQAKAYSVYPYPCIRLFTFTKLQISHLPVYPRVLELLSSHTEPIFLDMACCVGSDLRKVVMDGWPVELAIASDIQQGYWDAGHQLFGTTPETFPVNFLQGDAFDPSFIKPIEPVYSSSPSPHPDPQKVKSLTSLQGFISAIHASSFFHLFDEDGQSQLAKRLGSLLSPAPGSIIFGCHLSMPTKGLRPKGSDKESDHLMFCHSPESWEELWNGQVFAKGTVKVEASIKEVQMNHKPMVTSWYFLNYSVTRL
ncbi:hypothetical protein ONZ45_g2145 [Pleurotus djamor]|nr:hypothetical protein ONZ45_g2145 [Pleurotus djamor]